MCSFKRVSAFARVYVRVQTVARECVPLRAVTCLCVRACVCLRSRACGRCGCVCAYVRVWARNLGCVCVFR